MKDTGKVIKENKEDPPIEAGRWNQEENLKGILDPLGKGAGKL